MRKTIKIAILTSRKRIPRGRVLASLDQLVHQLARPHKTMIERGGSQKELVDLPLLQQLRYACKQDQRGGASGHSAGPSAPLALQATMDYRSIQAVIQGWHVHITGQNYGSIEQQLLTWATWAQSPAVLAVEPNHTDDCMVWCRGGVEKITNTLHHVRKGEISSACPECEATEAWDNIDGERTRIGHAIAVLGGVAKFLACGQQWAGKDLHTLAAKLWQAAEETTRKTAIRKRVALSITASVTRNGECSSEVSLRTGTRLSRMRRVLLFAGAGSTPGSTGTPAKAGRGAYTFLPCQGRTCPPTPAQPSLPPRRSPRG